MKDKLYDLRNKVYDDITDIADECGESREKALIEFKAIFDKLVENTLNG